MTIFELSDFIFTIIISTVFVFIALAVFASVSVALVKLIWWGLTALILVFL